FLVDDETVWVNPTQYLEPAWANVVPAPLSPEMRTEIEAFSDAARRALGVTSGITHLELFLTDSGLVFGELAARPPGGHIMPLVQHAYGVDPWESVLRVALGAPPGLPVEAEQSAASRIFHPGPGTVLEVAGVDQARGMPGVAKVRVAALGREISEREGTGQEAGHAIVTGATAAEAESRLAGAVGAIRIEVG
ncbi:MAG: hypothetical protein WBA11_04465, partial [Rubrivirga sp.]